jgi:hypothetical protein
MLRPDQDLEERTENTVYERIRAERKFAIHRLSNRGAEIVNADGSNLPEINFLVKLCRLYDHCFVC